MWTLIIVLISATGNPTYADKVYNLNEQSCIQAQEQLKHNGVVSVCVQGARS